jgi:hypothetical protein
MRRGLFVGGPKDGNRETGPFLRLAVSPNNASVFFGLEEAAFP